MQLLCFFLCVLRLICVKQVSAYFLHGIIINENDNESMLSLFGLNITFDKTVKYIVKSRNNKKI